MLMNDTLNDIRTRVVREAFHLDADQLAEDLQDFD